MNILEDRWFRVKMAALSQLNKLSFRKSMSRGDRKALQKIIQRVREMENPNEMA